MKRIDVEAECDPAEAEREELREKMKKALRKFYDLDRTIQKVIHKFHHLAKFSAPFAINRTAEILTKQKVASTGQDRRHESAENRGSFLCSFERHEHTLKEEAEVCAEPLLSSNQ
eukprot:SAG11_NODE_1703_length_4420_cov_1.855589_4_plen_115_part_00